MSEPRDIAKSESGESSHTTRIDAGWKEARRLSNEVIPKMAQQAMDAVVAERVRAENLASALRSLVGESWHRGSALGCQSQKNIDAARAALAEFTSAQPAHSTACSMNAAWRFDAECICGLNPAAQPTEADDG